MVSNRHRVLKISVIASIVLLAAVLGHSRFEKGLVGPDAHAPLRNYGVVWENKLTRSGLAKSDSGWQWLRNRGTDSIITFRPQNDVDYEKFGFERVFRIPLTSTQFPTDEQVNKFLAFM